MWLILLFHITLKLRKKETQKFLYLLLVLIENYNKNWDDKIYLIY